MGDAVKTPKAVHKKRIADETPEAKPPLPKIFADMSDAEKAAGRRKLEDEELILQDRARRAGFGINRDIEAMKKSIRLGEKTAKALSIRARTLANGKGKERCTTPVETAFMMHAASHLLNALPGAELEMRRVDYPKASDVIEIRNVDVGTSDIDELKRDAELLSTALPNKATYRITELPFMNEVRIHPEKSLGQKLNSTPRPEEANHMHSEGMKLLHPLPGKAIEVRVNDKDGEIVFSNVDMTKLRSLEDFTNEGMALSTKWGEGRTYRVKKDFDNNEVICELPS